MYEEHQKRWSTETTQTKIGCIGNPENLWYLSKIAEPIELVLERNDDVQLQIITDINDVNSVPFEERRENDVFYRQWSLENELSMLSESDIVVRPLTDDEWTRGKGGYTSVVQAMSLGIPVVVSPISMLSKLVDHGESGYHANNSADWEGYLTKLIKSRKRRRKMGQNAREAIEDVGLWTEGYAEAIANILQYASGYTDDLVIVENYAASIK